MAPPKEQQDLEHQLPDGQVVNRAWLQQHGFKGPLVDYYLRSGALKAVARGAYRRPGPPLKWEHIVYSLQELGLSVHVGGRSALELQGFAHYLPMQGVKQIHLYSADKLPSWLDKMDTPYQFVVHKDNLIDSPVEGALTTKPFGHWDWPVYYATPELALLQLASQVSAESDFEMLDKLFEAATTLRPQLLMSLLLACHNIKTKRVFLWFADRHDFAWFNRLDLNRLDLGSGKRMLVKGGALDTTYLITVPKSMHNEDTDGLEQSFL
ncbi:MAG: type IV toxin-antitoxin system AbiEi family antitoxin [Pseudomonadales bacterium]|nr:type IV toxin-antitoxin system AbiEi family antitoxin [Pseudomonadales bacterium]